MAFKDDFEAVLAGIHAQGGITDDQVTTKITAATAPLTDALATTQTEITDLQDTLLELAKKLASGDTAGAQETLQNAQTSVGNINAAVDPTTLSTAVTAAADTDESDGSPAGGIKGEDESA